MQNTCFTESGSRVSCFAACEIKIILAPPTMNTSCCGDQPVILLEMHRECWSTQCKDKKTNFCFLPSCQQPTGRPRIY